MSGGAVVKDRASIGWIDLRPSASAPVCCSLMPFFGTAGHRTILQTEGARSLPLAGPRISSARAAIRGVKEPERIENAHRSTVSCGIASKRLFGLLSARSSLWTLRDSPFWRGSGENARKS